MQKQSKLTSRRAFLSFLASSPAFLGARTAMGQLLHEAYAPEAVSRASDAINVFDFHEVAKQVMSVGHYTYMALGTDSGGTLRANRAGYDKLQLRTRRLVDVQRVDTSIELFGEQYPLPILIAPVGHQKAFHAEGELPVARAANAKGVEQILSTVTSVPVEEVNAARGKPVWYQLYTISEWRDTLAMVKRAEASGCPVLAVTVDLPVSNREILARHRRDTNAACQACHAPNAGVIPPKPMTGGAPINTRFVDWDYIDRLRDATSMRIVLKGLVAAEDARLAVEHGIDGIIVSNHGGRAEDSGRGTIESLPEVVDAVDGRMPVIVDGGIRRGTDIFKALALGADAVAIGRPYIWGLSAFGQEGVEAVLDILKRELEIIMMQARTRRIDEIDRDYIV